MRLALPLLAAAVGLAACDAVGDPDSLAPGTYELSVDGRTSRGDARFYPRLDLALSPAAVFLSCTDPFVIESDGLLTASPDDEVEPRVDYRPPGRSYQRVRGTVEVTERTAQGVRGRFSLRIKDFSTGPITAGETTAKGAFYASTLEVGEGC